MRQVVESASEGDIADRPVAHRGVIQVAVAARQPPLPDMVHDRGPVAREEAVDMADREFAPARDKLADSSSLKCVSMQSLMRTRVIQGEFRSQP